LNFFNPAGLVNAIQEKESGGSFANVINSISYAPNGLPAVTWYADGATTTNTYNSNALYRLISKVTLTPLTTTLVLGSSSTIAFDNSGTGGTSCGSTPCSSLTFPYTVNSNTNGLIIVNVGLNDYTDSVTGVSYGGHALTFYGDAYDVTVGAVSVWYMLGELSGTNNVVINASSAHIFGATAASYTGVSQTGLPDAVGTGSPQDHTSADGLFAGSVTTVANNAWAFLALAKNGGATPTAGSNTTLRVDDTNDGSDSLYDSGGPVTP